MSNEQQSLQVLPVEPNKPSWRFLYLKALHAQGIEETTRALMAAEEAMFLRWQELCGEASHVQECDQLHEASDELLKIKIEKLGWPKPFPD